MIAFGSAVGFLDWQRRGGVVTVAALALWLIACVSINVLRVRMDVERRRMLFRSVYAAVLASTGFLILLSLQHQPVAEEAVVAALIGVSTTWLLAWHAHGDWNLWRGDA